MSAGRPSSLLALGAVLAGWTASAPAAPARDGTVPPLARQVPVEDPSGVALESFGRALLHARAGKGQARVVVLGASHTAADYWTGHLRRAFQRRYGDGGPGLLLPGRPWKGARHDALELAASDGWKTLRSSREDPATDGLWGITGAAVASSGEGQFVRIGAREGPPPRTRFDRVEVWFLAQPAGGTFEVRLGSRVLAEVPTGSPEVHARRWTASGVRDRGPLEVRVRGDGEVRLLGVALDRDQPGVTVDALGVPGARLQDLLHAREDLLRETLAWRRPDLLVLAFGTNEAYDPDLDLAAYAAALHDGIRRLRSFVPQASCLILGPGALPKAPDLPGAPPGARRKAVTDAQRQASQDEGCAFFDTAQVMDGEEGMARWVDASLASRDRIHLTEAGYRVLGEVLYRGLLEALKAPSYRRPPRRSR